MICDWPIPVYHILGSRVLSFFFIVSRQPYCRMANWSFSTSFRKKKKRANVCRCAWKRESSWFWRVRTALTVSGVTGSTEQTKKLLVVSPSSILLGKTYMLLNHVFPIADEGNRRLYERQLLRQWGIELKIWDKNGAVILSQEEKGAHRKWAGRKCLSKKKKVQRFDRKSSWSFDRIGSFVLLIPSFEGPSEQRSGDTLIGFAKSCTPLLKRRAQP